MTLTKLTAHEKTCKHRKIKCQYCENSYKPDEEELHLQKCGLIWKQRWLQLLKIQLEKCDEKLKGLGIEECPSCEKRLSD